MAPLSAKTFLASVPGAPEVSGAPVPPPAEGDAVGGFASLIDGLVKEHARLEAALRKLSSDNDRLRFQNRGRSQTFGNGTPSSAQAQPLLEPCPPRVASTLSGRSPSSPEGAGHRIVFGSEEVIGARSPAASECSMSPSASAGTLAALAEDAPLPLGAVGAARPQPPGGRPAPLRVAALDEGGSPTCSTAAAEALEEFRQMASECTIRSGVPSDAEKHEKKESTDLEFGLGISKPTTRSLDALPLIGKVDSDALSPGMAFGRRSNFSESGFGRSDIKSPSSEPDSGTMVKKRATNRVLGSGQTMNFANSGFSTNLPPVWPEWELKDGDESDCGGIMSSTSTARPTFFRKSLVDAHRKQKHGGRVTADSGRLRNFILHPNSATRVFWDMASLILIAYDLIGIPLDLAGFDLSEGRQIIDVFDKCTAAFWLIDIAMSMLTGYHTGGLVEMRPQEISKKYVRSWFLFDFSVVIADWLLIILGGSAVLRFGKAKRLVRVIRTFRLLRSVKMTAKIMDLLESLRSETLRITFNIAGLAISILALNHFIACGWYFVGTSVGEDITWVQRHVNGEPVGMRYATALHWSITQFTPAAMEIHPSNFAERVYTVIVVFFAMITFSTFMGSITVNMTTLRRLQSDPAVHQKILFDYFTEHGVSAELGTRTWGYLKKYHFATKSKVMKKDIEVLKVLPASIHCALNEELYIPVVEKCPYFFQYGCQSFVGLSRVVNEAVREVGVTIGEQLFQGGVVAEGMYFITSGLMRYRHSKERLSADLEKGQWLSEPAMWMRWHRCGTLQATTCCLLLEISAAKFRAIVTEHGRAMSFTRCYVEKLRTFMLEEAINMGHTWKTDIWMQAAQIKKVALEALPEHQLFAALDNWKSPWFRQTSHDSAGSRG